MSCVLKCPINVTANPNPVYSHILSSDNMFHLNPYYLDHLISWVYWTYWECFITFLSQPKHTASWSLWYADVLSHCIPILLKDLIHAEYLTSGYSGTSNVKLIISKHFEEYSILHATLCSLERAQCFGGPRSAITDQHSIASQRTLLVIVTAARISNPMILFTHAVHFNRGTSDKKITLFWEVTICSLVDIYQCFKGSWCLHFQGGRWR
jgi:hypothetical protein